ncbi:PfkB family carbohydrate kinase [Nitratireductor luteus]|uniref:PfkB family carbohydrate kinase n=1 Tax=Nitratireductor luteus TaxID=2976980 RepID=UPI0022402D9D|nr:PfkB family carbohydrate kinase [Nitratireductor luteus]
MARIVTAGVAVIDFLMHLDEMPSRPEKYRARDAAIVGGGGGANSAVAVARLGGEAMLATRLGGDAIGTMILDGLATESVDCRLIKRFAGRRSSFSSIFIDAAGERQIVNYRDLDMDFGADWLEEAAVPAFDAALADTRWPQGAAVLMRLARARGKPGVIDAEAPVTEAADALGLCSHAAFSAQGLRDFAGEEALDEALRKAAARLDAFVCVTDGGRGTFWLEKGGIAHEPAPKVTVVDTLGAGDVWHGAFALMLGEGKDTRAAIRFANAAASLKCTRFGGREGAPDRPAVERLIAGV